MRRGKEMGSSISWQVHSKCLQRPHPRHLPEFPKNPHSLPSTKGVHQVQGKPQHSPPDTVQSATPTPLRWRLGGRVSPERESPPPPSSSLQATPTAGQPPTPPPAGPNFPVASCRVEVPPSGPSFSPPRPRPFPSTAWLHPPPVLFAASTVLCGSGSYLRPTDSQIVSSPQLVVCKLSPVSPWHRAPPPPALVHLVFREERAETGQEAV